MMMLNPLQKIQMIMKWINLHPRVRDEGYRLGRARYENNRQHAINTHQIKGVDPVKSDCEGVCGELAFAQMVGAGDDQIKHIGVTTRESDEGDVIYNGVRIDVKTTRYLNGHLLIYSHKLQNPKIDGYVLMVGHFGRYCFKGFISSDEVRELIEQDLSLIHI